MNKQFSTLLAIGWVAAFLPMRSFAEPLVTITCGEPKGVTQEYGVSNSDRIAAHIGNKPEPPANFRGPVTDGISQKATFIVDSGKTKLTRIWAESVADAKLREDAKKPGIPGPSEPLPADEMDIQIFSSSAIVAIETAWPGGASVYSFYPRLGMMFLVTQFIQSSGQNAVQSAFSAKCEFSWNSAALNR